MLSLPISTLAFRAPSHFFVQPLADGRMASPIFAMADDAFDLKETRYLWGDYEDGRDPIREVLQLLDMWDDEQVCDTLCVCSAVVQI